MLLQLLLLLTMASVHDGQLVGNYSVDVSSDKTSWTNLVNGNCAPTEAIPSVCKGGQTIGKLGC